MCRVLGKLYVSNVLWCNGKKGNINEIKDGYESHYMHIAR